MEILLNAHGVDISSYQGKPDMDMLSQKADFVMMRHSIGMLYDTSFQHNWTNAENKILRGIYYVPHPQISGGRAKEKLREIFEYKTDFPVILDIEMNGIYIDATYGLAAYIYQKTGTYPIIYTAPSFWKSLWGFANSTHEKFFKNCPLWIANYGVEKPAAVAPWGDNWTFWQYKINGNWDEVKEYGLRQWESKAIDVNWYNGTYDQLINWTGSAVPMPVGKEVAVEIDCAFYWLRTEPRYEDITEDIVLPEGYIAELTGQEHYEEASGITWLEVKLHRHDYIGWLSKNLKYIRMIRE